MTTSGFAAITARRSAVGVEGVGHHTARAERLDRGDFPGRPRGAGDGMAGVTQQLEQRLPDHAGRAGNEDIHDRSTLRCHCTAAWTCAVS